MRAVAFADGEVVVGEVPDPEPQGDQVLVRVEGAGLNRADLLQRAGFYPPPPGAPDTPGLEFAGIVEAAGPAVHGCHLGDRVMGIAAGGGQAELIVVPESHCARVPDNLDLVEAGGVPEAFVTAHDALFTQACLDPDDTVLIHAVGSGVGTAALQLAAALGCTTVGTARSPEKLKEALALGLTHAVEAPRDLDPPALAAAVRDAAGDGADVVIDLVGGAYVGVDVAVANLKGRIVLVGAVAGARAEVNVVEIMGKRLEMRGTVLRARDDREKADATHAFAGHVLPLLRAGTVRPVIAEVVPLAEAARAYDLLASDTVFGKIVLDCR